MMKRCLTRIHQLNPAGEVDEEQYMKRFVPAFFAVSLALLLGLGSQGCGCSSDTVQPVVGKLQECCCTLEWTPADGIEMRDVVVVLEGASEGLWPDARPYLLTGVNQGEPASFQVCVDTTHPPGATVTVLLRDQHNGTEYGRALLVYEQPCGPAVQPIDTALDLRTTDCGG